MAVAPINRHRRREERNMATWTDTSDNEDLSSLIQQDHYWVLICVWDNIYRCDYFGWHVYYLSWIYDLKEKRHDMVSWQWTIRCHSSSADLTIGQTPLTRAIRMAWQCIDHHIIMSWPSSTKRESYVWGSKTGIMSSRRESLGLYNCRVVCCSCLTHFMTQIEILLLLLFIHGLICLTGNGGGGGGVVGGKTFVHENNIIKTIIKWRMNYVNSFCNPCLRRLLY